MKYSFYLFKKDIHYKDAFNLIRQHNYVDFPVVDIHIYIINYINVTSQWIPTFIMINDYVSSKYGLHHLGPVIIEQEGALLLEKICNMWSTLFATSSEQLSLNEAPYFQFESRILNRDEVISSLKDLACFAKMVKEGSYYIIQMGM
jgi:hypothetical protein